MIVTPVGRAFRLPLFPSAVWVSPGRSPEQEACCTQVTALRWRSPPGRVAQVCMRPPLWAWRRVRGTQRLRVLVTSGGVSRADFLLGFHAGLHGRTVPVRGCFKC